MEKINIPYEEWPEWMKLMTAFRIKSITIRDPGAIVGLSIVNIVAGLLLLFTIYKYNEDAADGVSAICSDFWSIYLILLNFIIAFFNLAFTKNAIVWIRNNSSWEERDEHKSESKYQFQYFLMWAVIAVISWGVACLFCC